MILYLYFAGKRVHNDCTHTCIAITSAQDHVPIAKRSSGTSGTTSCKKLLRMYFYRIS